MLVLSSTHDQTVSDWPKKENIVQFKDFTDEGKPLLVMEYLGPYRSNSLWRK